MLSGTSWKDASASHRQYPQAQIQSWSIPFPKKHDEHERNMCWHLDSSHSSVALNMMHPKNTTKNRFMIDPNVHSRSAINLQRQVDALRILCPDWSKISERTTSTASVPWLGLGRKDLWVDFSRVLHGGTPCFGLGILEPKTWAATDVYSFILWDLSEVTD